MAIMNWKQNIGEGGLTSERGKQLLKNFRYPTEIDKKGRLLIDAGLSKFVIAFKDNGPDSTIIGVSHFKIKPVTFLLMLILLVAFVIPGFIFGAVVNSKRKKVFEEAVRLMNQNLFRTDQGATKRENPKDKIQNLKEMKDQGLISDEEYEKKRQEIIARM